MLKQFMLVLHRLKVKFLNYLDCKLLELKRYPDSFMKDQEKVALRGLVWVENSPNPSIYEDQAALGFRLGSGILKSEHTR